MLRVGLVLMLLFCLQMTMGSESLERDMDFELETFKRAVKQKRSAADMQTLVKCSLPLANENGEMTENEKARKLGVCLARTAMKKESEGKDSASDMVRRISNIVTDDRMSLVRKGWWSNAVNKVKGWFKKHGETIKKGIKIAVDILKAIFGKK